MDLVKLSNLCKMQSGGTPSRSNLEYYEGDIAWAKISDLEKRGDGYIYETEEHISEVALQSINNRFFKEGTLLLAMYGSVGKTAITKIDLTTNQAILGINIIDKKLLDIKYLKYWFTTIKEQLLNRAVGAALANISLGIVKDLKIPLPSLPLQQSIVAILDAADALRQNDKALIAKYDELTQALFLDMFGDPVSNPKGWEKREILDLINPNRPITYGILMPKEDVKPIGIPYIKVVDVKNGLILHDRVCHTSEIIESKYKRSRLKENDLLISIRGHVGRICLVPQIYINANITQDTARLDFNKDIEPLFAEYCLGSTEFQRYMSKYVKGAGVKGINLGDLKKLLLIVPDINIQKKFAVAMLSLKLQKDLAQKSFAKSEELFNSLLQKAFKGGVV